jgi:hypothetical protein
VARDRTLVRTGRADSIVGLDFRGCKMGRADLAIVGVEVADGVFRRTR